MARERGGYNPPKTERPTEAERNAGGKERFRLMDALKAGIEEGEQGGFELLEALDGWSEEKLDFDRQARKIEELLMDLQTSTTGIRAQQTRHRIKAGHDAARAQLPDLVKVASGQFHKLMEMDGKIRDALGKDKRGLSTDEWANRFQEMRGLYVFIDKLQEVQGKSAPPLIDPGDQRRFERSYSLVDQKMEDLRPQEESILQGGTRELTTDQLLGRLSQAQETARHAKGDKLPEALAKMESIEAAIKLRKTEKEQPLAA